MNHSQSIQELREIVAQVENLDDAIAELQGDRKEVVGEAKARGFDGKTINAVVKRRRMLPSERAEADILVATYEEALSGWPRGLVDGGVLCGEPHPGQPRIAAPDAMLSKKELARAEQAAWARGDIGR